MRPTNRWSTGEHGSHWRSRSRRGRHCDRCCMLRRLQPAKPGPVGDPTAPACGANRSGMRIIAPRTIAPAQTAIIIDFASSRDYPVRIVTLPGAPYGLYRSRFREKHRRSDFSLYAPGSAPLCGECGDRGLSFTAPEIAVCCMIALQVVRRARSCCRSDYVSSRLPQVAMPTLPSSRQPLALRGVLRASRPSQGGRPYLWG